MFSDFLKKVDISSGNLKVIFSGIVLGLKSDSTSLYFGDWERLHKKRGICWAVVGTYRKWYIDCVTTSFRHEVFCPRGIYSRGERSLLCIICRDRRAATVKIANS